MDETGVGQAAGIDATAIFVERQGTLGVLALYVAAGLSGEGIDAEGDRGTPLTRNNDRHLTPYEPFGRPQGRRNWSCALRSARSKERAAPVAQSSCLIPEGWP